MPSERLQQREFGQAHLSSERAETAATIKTLRKTRHAERVGLSESIENIEKRIEEHEISAAEVTKDIEEINNKIDSKSKKS